MDTSTIKVPRQVKDAVFIRFRKYLCFIFVLIIRLLGQQTFTFSIRHFLLGALGVDGNRDIVCPFQCQKSMN